MGSTAATWTDLSTVQWVVADVEMNSPRRPPVPLTCASPPPASPPRAALAARTRGRPPPRRHSAPRAASPNPRFFFWFRACGSHRLEVQLVVRHAIDFLLLRACGSHRWGGSLPGSTAWFGHSPFHSLFLSVGPLFHPIFEFFYFFPHVPIMEN